MPSSWSVSLHPSWPRRRRIRTSPPGRSRGRGAPVTRNHGFYHRKHWGNHMYYISYMVYIYVYIYMCVCFYMLLYAFICFYIWFLAPNIRLFDVFLAHFPSKLSSLTWVTQRVTHRMCVTSTAGWWFQPNIWIIMVNIWILYGIWLMMANNNLVSGIPTYPSEKWWTSSVGMMTFPMYGKS